MHVTLPEAARRLGVSYRTARRWAKAGKLRVKVSPGGRMYVEDGDLEQVWKRK